MITVDYSNTLGVISKEEIEAKKEGILAAKKTLVDGTGEGSEFTGWIDLPVNYDKEEFERIKRTAKKIQSDSDVLLVIGVGGSYLGARATIEALTHSFYNILGKEKRKTPQVFFCGNNVSPKYAADLMELIGDKDISVNVISKSGTTTEPAIAFRLFKKFLEDKYGEEAAAKRIYATTDKVRGALKTMADDSGYETFVVPDDIGGRYSVLTAVGLLPIAVAGIDIDMLMAGAQNMRKICLENEYHDNPALTYAAIRNLMHDKGKRLEIVASFEPRLHFIAEWWKQLYGESEGKDKKGLFPVSVDFTTDLHSFGQIIQDGPRVMFETILNIKENDAAIIMGHDEKNLDQLNYLEGMDMDSVNKSCMTGALLAHADGGAPNMMISMEKEDAYNLGELFYMFEFACGVSGYYIEVNPFNQPGVEFYKRNMFAILGKPGYEKEHEAILKRL